MSKFFCVLESIDGGGTHVQSQLLASKLSQLNLDWILLRYPDYSGEFGKLIKKHLWGELDLPQECIFLIYLLDQLKDSHKIRQSLDSGKIVICDRYFTSNLAYQSARGFPLEMGLSLAELLKIPKPDLVLFLDLPAELAIRRKLGEKPNLDRYESDLEFLERVRANYLNLARSNVFSSEWKVIDGSGSIQQVFHEIWEMLSSKLRL